MKFSKYLSLTIFALSLTAHINLQCMLTTKEKYIFDGFIDLNNPTMVKNALISAADQMIISKKSSEQCAGLDLFFDIVTRLEQGFDDAELACITCFETNDNQVKKKVLDLLPALVSRGHAIDTTLGIIMKALTAHEEIKNRGYEILHHIIINEKNIRIPKATVMLILIEHYSDKKISDPIKGILRKIFTACQQPETDATTSAS